MPSYLPLMHLTIFNGQTSTRAGGQAVARALLRAPGGPRLSKAVSGMGNAYWCCLAILATELVFWSPFASAMTGVREPSMIIEPDLVFSNTVRHCRLSEVAPLPYGSQLALILLLLSVW